MNTQRVELLPHRLRVADTNSDADYGRRRRQEPSLLAARRPSFEDGRLSGGNRNFFVSVERTKAVPRKSLSGAW